MTSIELSGISKSFGSVKANDKISLDVHGGEILALLGENGSGKTTLMNIIAGIYHPDEGSIKIDGKEVSINSPMAASELGIGMIHQHFKLVDVYSAADNVILGSKKEGFLLKKSRGNKISEICSRFGLEIDPKKKVYNMSVGEKQTVEIIKVLYRGAKILILDEPTAVLTPNETEKLFDILRKMKSEGCAVIIITHKLNEVMAVSDRVTILHKGKSVATVKTGETNTKQLTELMVGRPVELSINRPQPLGEENMLEIHHLTVKNGEGVAALKDVSFNMRKGEILGVAGVAGSGQKELCDCIAGLTLPEEGAILYNKTNIIGKSPRDIINMGISMSFVPEDRLGMGLAASMGMVENVLLKSYHDQKGIFLKKADARRLSERLVEEYEISTPDIDTPVRMLSGGNVQKVLLGREIASSPNVLITAYAVRGLDINSSYTIYDALNEQKKKGVAVLFIGEDLDVMLQLCDRIMVLCRGELMGIVDARTAYKEDIGLMMTGTRKEEE